MQAGRLEVPVVADTTGFAAKLRTAVEAATEGLSAAVQVAVDDKSLVEARGKIEAAMAGITAHVEVRVDEDRARTYLRDVIGRAADGLKANVQINADTRGLADEVSRRFAVDREGTISVGANTTDALVEAEAARKVIDAKRATMHVGVNRERLRDGLAGVGADVARQMQEWITSMNSAERQAQVTRRTFASVFNVRPVERWLARVGRGLQMFGMITGVVSIVEGLGSALTGLVGGLSAVVGGLYAIAGATGPAIAGLSVLPNLIAAAAQAGATLFAAFSGIGGAVSAIRNEQQAATGAAVNTAQVQQDNARRIADARRAVADATENAARRVQAAERGLRDAQEASRFAQDRLNDARKTAKERLQDLNLELRQAALDEEGAAIGLERAKERFNEVAANPFASALDRREAKLAYQQALQQVDEVAERNDDLAREGGELRKKGIKGSDEVVDAKRAIRDAQQAELDAERALVDARRDSVRAVADAQRHLADAQKQAAGPTAATAAATNQLEQAMAKLSPEARDFAYFIADELIPALEGLRNEVAAELLPTIENGLRRLLTTLLPAVTEQLVESARGAAKWFERLFTFLGSKQFTQDFTFIGDGNQRALRRFGAAALFLLRALTDIMVVVAQPGGLLDGFSRWVREVAKGWAEATSLNRETGKMFNFFDRSARVIGLWGDIFRNTWGGLVGLGSAGSKAGMGLLRSLRRATRNFDQWTQDNRAKLQDWFTSVAETTRMVGDILVDITVGLGKIADDPNTQKMVQSLRDDVIPSIGRLVKALQESEAGQRFADMLVALFDMITAIVNSGGFQAFLDVMTRIFRRLQIIADDPVGSKVIGFFASLFGTLGAAALVLGPLMRMTGVLSQLSRVLGRGFLKALGFVFGIGGGGGGSLAKGAAARASFGAGAAATGAGAAGLLAALFGQSPGPAGRGGPGAAKLESLLGQYGRGGAAAATTATKPAGLLSRLFKGKGGRIGIAAGLGAILFGATAGANNANAAGPDLFYDPQSGIYVDPTTGAVFDSSGGLRSYPAATPPPGAPKPPRGLDGLSLGLGAGAFGLGGRALYKGGKGGAGYTPRAGLTLSKGAAGAGIKNAIRSFGPKAFKVAGGPIGWGALGVDFLGSAIDSGRGDLRGNAASMLKGAGGGAAVGALVGSVVPVIGTALGAAAGGVIGGLVGWLKRPNEQMIGMRDNAVKVGENIAKWYNAGRGSDLPDLAFRNVATALQDVGAAAFETARKTGTYQDALKAADDAMRTQYTVIRDTLMEAYDLTETQVEDLIGTYDEYNAKQALPKTLRAKDEATRTIEEVEEGLERYATKNGPDHLTKRLDADDKASPKVDWVERKLAGLDEQKVRPKLLRAVDRVTGPLSRAVMPSLAEYNGFRPAQKNLVLRSNHVPVVNNFRTWLNGIPNVITKFLNITPVLKSAIVPQPSMVSSPAYNDFFGMAEGGTVHPRQGGTLVRLAEAGRPETVVDTGLQNEMMRRIIDLLDNNGGRQVIAEITQNVYNPVPETPSESLTRRMRQAAEFGLIGTTG